MLIKEYFIFNKDGMNHEYNKILKGSKHLFKVNGHNKEALKFLYKLLEDDKKKFEEYVELKSLEFILREKSLGEISESIEDEISESIEDEISESIEDENYIEIRNVRERYSTGDI